MISSLKGIVPDSVIAQLPGIKEIATPLRLAHFLSQGGHESDGFKRTVENLNYSPTALRNTFKKYFSELELIAYSRNPERIGNRVYANRMGNGNEGSGEGYKFRGRGFMQLTGRDNYLAFSKFIGEDCVTNPDLVATKYPLASAAFFFSQKNIWAICDQGDSDQVITAATKKVNGGDNGLPDRIARFRQIQAALSRQ